MNNRKGIILAGGTGSRLFPITKSISKQLLPVFDKPMIYYPLCTLMEANIRKISIISSNEYLPLYKKLLGNGASLGIELNYIIQEKPNGIAEAFLLASDFIGDSPSALILGDNLFYGEILSKKLVGCNKNTERSTIFTFKVKDPKRYGVVTFNKDFKVIDIEEKPKSPKSNSAITGLYFYGNDVVEKARTLIPSKRGELEITDLNKIYCDEGILDVEELGKGSVWFDTGTFESLHEASSYIKTMENRQSFKIGCPEEVAWRKNWIGDEDLYNLAKPLLKSGYGDYLIEILKK